MLTKFVRWLFGQFHDRASVLLALLAADALLLLFAGVKLVQLDYEVSGSLTAGMWFYGSLILLAGSLGLSLGKRLFRELAGSDDRPNATLGDPPKN